MSETIIWALLAAFWSAGISGWVAYHVGHFVGYEDGGTAMHNAHEYAAAFDKFRVPLAKSVSDSDT